jgi:hypothetical protein
MSFLSKVKLWIIVGLLGLVATPSFAIDGIAFKGIGGVGIPLSGGYVPFVYGAGVAYRAKSGLQFGLELDANSFGGATLAGQLDFFISDELYLGVQTGFGLSSPNLFLVGAQLGYEHGLIPNVLVLGPNIEYKYYSANGASNLLLLVQLKLYL